MVLRAQLGDPPELDRVSEEELEVYIDVYKALQSDRSLKIADVVATRDMTVPDFRAIERRVQNQQRLVQRVREALLEQAKENAANLAVRAPDPQ